MPAEMILWMALSGLLHGVYIISLSRAYQTQDISYVYPIARSAPAFVPLVAFFFLGERLSFLNGVGIFVVLLAVYTLHFKGHLIEGFKNLWNAIIHRDMRWAFITLMLVVSYSLVDKESMSRFLALFPDTPFQNGLVFFFGEALLGFTLCNLYLFVRNPKAEIFSVWKNEWPQGLLAGFATIASYGLICVVLQHEDVSQVVAVRQVSVLMVVLWGVFKLKEGMGMQRGLACAMILFGIWLVSL